MSMSTNEFSMFLGRTVRIIISDGRVIEGELACMDKDLNFVLNSAIEYHGVEPGDDQFQLLSIVCFT